MSRAAAARALLAAGLVVTWAPLTRAARTLTSRGAPPTPLGGAGDDAPAPAPLIGAALEPDAATAEWAVDGGSAALEVGVAGDAALAGSAAARGTWSAAAARALARHGGSKARSGAFGLAARVRQAPAAFAAEAAAPLPRGRPFSSFDGRGPGGDDPPPKTAQARNASERADDEGSRQPTETTQAGDASERADDEGYWQPIEKVGMPIDKVYGNLRYLEDVTRDFERSADDHLHAVEAGLRLMPLALEQYRGESHKLDERMTTELALLENAPRHIRLAIARGDSTKARRFAMDVFDFFDKMESALKAEQALGRVRNHLTTIHGQALGTNAWELFSRKFVSTVQNRRTREHAWQLFDTLTSRQDTELRGGNRWTVGEWARQIIWVERNL